MGGDGSVSEWLKEHAWKACRVGRLSQVRILSLPPNKRNPFLGFILFDQSRRQDENRRFVTQEWL